MRQVSIKQLKASLSSELLDLPCEITKYGQVVAIIIKGSHKSAKKVVTSPPEAEKGSHNTSKGSYHLNKGSHKSFMPYSKADQTGKKK